MPHLGTLPRRQVFSGCGAALVCMFSLPARSAGDQTMIIVSKVPIGQMPAGFTTA